jgi:hypothetical protein
MQSNMSTTPTPLCRAGYWNHHNKIHLTTRLRCVIDENKIVEIFRLIATPECHELVFSDVSYAPFINSIFDTILRINSVFNNRNYFNTPLKQKEDIYVYGSILNFIISLQLYSPYILLCPKGVQFIQEFNLCPHPLFNSYRRSTRKMSKPDRYTP